MESSKQIADAVNKVDQRVMDRDIIAWLGIGHSSVQEIISKVIKDIFLNQVSRNSCILL
jgi:hypothetical protein